MEEIVDFVRFPCVAAPIWGKIAVNVKTGSLLDTLVLKLKKKLTLNYNNTIAPLKKKNKIGDETC